MTAGIGRRRRRVRRGGSPGAPVIAHQPTIALRSLSALPPMSVLRTLGVRRSMSARGTMHARPSTSGLIFPLLIVALSGCPDPCVFGGNACNKTSDCGASEVCRVARDFEVASGCFIVEGKCFEVEESEDIACGSVDDCLENECCDPDTNLCVNSWGYTGAQCDAFTCGDCEDTPFGERCADDDACDAGETCALDESIFEESTGVCRPSCVNDNECAFAQRCESGVCSVDVGTPCLIENTSTSQQQCLGLKCVNIDDDGQQTDAYCTGDCTSFGEPGCPAGFVCDGIQLECRKL